ncbi:MAG: hypothetical protein Rpha_1376 [Candidatus Ruthia sp. Apha_13_S6]|nr:hypothetical protein [Candidatus Ruthia sp. Apha_13_S6]
MIPIATPKIKIKIKILFFQKFNLHSELSVKNYARMMLQYQTQCKNLLASQREDDKK